MMNNWFFSLLVLLFTNASDGVLIEEGHEQAEFTQHDGEPLTVTLLCPGKYTTISDSSNVTLQWHDITSQGQTDLIVTIDNSSDVNIGPDFRGRAEVTRLSSERLNGSIELTLKDVGFARLKVFLCEVNAVGDQPSFYSRPVYAQNTVPDERGAHWLAGICLAVSISSLILLVITLVLMRATIKNILSAAKLWVRVTVVILIVVVVGLSIAGIALSISRLAAHPQFPYQYSRGTVGVLIGTDVCSVLGPAFLFSLMVIVTVVSPV